MPFLLRAERALQGNLRFGDPDEKPRILHAASRRQAADRVTAASGRSRLTFASLPAGLLEGKAMLQNLPSAVAAIVLAPVPGSRILDMCAAPGELWTAPAPPGPFIGRHSSHTGFHRQSRDVRRLPEPPAQGCGESAEEGRGGRVFSFALTR